MVDFKKHQPRGRDGKYKTYHMLIKLIKQVVELCQKKVSTSIKS